MASPRESSPHDAPAQALERILAEARLLVLDVDGTLTDGRVSYVGDEELATFHVHDGLGLIWLRERGVHVAWISGRGSRAVERRARELGVRELHLGVKDKARVLDELQRRLDIAPAQTVVMGDDLADLGLAAHAALFVAPANARPEVARQARLVTCAGGGAGAVRELAERMLAARGSRPAGPASPRRPSDGAPEAAE